MRPFKKLNHFIKRITHNKANKKGFTLVELIICVAVLAILSLYVVQMLSISSTFYRKQTNQSEVQSRTSVVLNTVGDIFKNARTIAVNEDDSTLTINSYDAKITSDTQDYSITKLLYDKAADKLYIGYDCDSTEKNIKLSDYLFQDGVTSFSVDGIEGGKDAEVSISILMNGRSYTEKIHTYIRNSETKVKFNVEGGWVPLPTEA